MRRQWNCLSSLTFHLSNMAKLSMIEREKKRERLNNKYQSKIKMIKEKLKDTKTSDEEDNRIKKEITKDTSKCLGG